MKPTYHLDGGLAVDREDRYIYLASNDGHIRVLHNGQVKDFLFLEFHSFSNNA